MQAIYQAALPFDDVVTDVVCELPPLPSVLRYYDEFDDKIRSIVRLDATEIIEIKSNGIKRIIDLSKYDSSHSHLLKQVLVYLFSEDLSPLTAVRYLADAQFIKREVLEALLLGGPKGVNPIWERLRGQTLPHATYLFVKALLRLLSSHRLRGWSDDYAHLLSHTLPLPEQDKYAGVRSGDVFLSIEEESAVVRHLDMLADSLCKLPVQTGNTELNDSAILMCAYQFGMRPLQIATVRLRDVRIWDTGDTVNPAVHITFPMIKQKTASNSRPLTRKVKPEWSILVRELHFRRYESGAVGEDRLFAMGSGQETGRRISDLLTKLIPGGATATDLRHTAAQRLVDAGASQEELAEFLGHSDITTGLVYYATSANQAERVNKALGLSAIYSKVAKIAHDKFISQDELADLKDDQQIAGVPHGIPIAGIGGCSSGQPLCPSNPILACYGCHKFMPIHEIHVHEQVLSDFRGVVLFFHESSRGDKDSPAYLQLQRTISSVEAIIEELREDAK